jgi:hypothetical protein
MITKEGVMAKMIIIEGCRDCPKLDGPFNGGTFRCFKTGIYFRNINIIDAACPLPDAPSCEREGKEKKMAQIDPVYDFAYKIAKVLKEISSSHVFFIMQQAFGEEMEWDSVVELLNTIIALSALPDTPPAIEGEDTPAEVQGDKGKEG